MSLRYSILIIAIGILGFLAYFLPLREIYSYLQFKFFTEKAKVNHLIKLKNASIDQEIVILGSAHNQHLYGDSYPLWELKSVILKYHPQVLFVEIRPHAMEEGRWGEGPIEMPFCAAVGKEAGIVVKGMDYWLNEKTKFEVRDDNMVKNILKVLVEGKKFNAAMVITGFSHLPGFVKRLKRQGYEQVEWSDADKTALLKGDVERKYPSILEIFLEGIIAQVRSGKTEYSKYPEWIKHREFFLKKIQGKK